MNDPYEIPLKDLGDQKEFLAAKLLDTKDKLFPQIENRQPQGFVEKGNYYSEKHLGYIYLKPVLVLIGEVYANDFKITAQTLEFEQKVPEELLSW